jgi:carbamoylphosphate synthase large subunit
MSVSNTMSSNFNAVTNKKEHHVVLLGSAGTGIAFAAACALRRVWSQSVKIVAIDINPRHLVTTSLLADVFEQVPLSASPKFSESLLGILRRYEVDTYLPLFPEEIALAALLHSKRNIPASVSVMAPPPMASAACADKWALSQLLPMHGVPVPETAPASAPFAAEEFILKPKDGTGSRGVQKVKASELSMKVSGRAGEWVVQEICMPPEVTVDSFYDPADGFCRVICRERIEIKSGVSTKARLFEEPELSRIALALAEALKLAGSFCFQVMRNTTGWVVTDVNPRPGAATAMCALTGNDFFAASFAQHWGEDVRRFFRPLDGEQFVTRQYAEFLMGSKA